MIKSEKIKHMSLKDDLLEYFAKHPAIVLNSEQFARGHGVSAIEIRQAAEALRKDGFPVVVTDRGYLFSDENDPLSAEMIRFFDPGNDAPVYVFDQIDSTNNYAKILCREYAAHGTMVVADSQTAGRGRQGHTFYSPKNTGLYFSLIIRPEPSALISRITPAAAVSAVEAIKETTGIRPGIKWVNDLFVGKKKIAGILCEAISGDESGKIRYVIIGIGINCRTMEFPDELKEIAGSLSADHISRSALAASLRKHLLANTSRMDEEMMKKYRDNSLVLGKDITYSRDNVLYNGTVEDINDLGNLIIKKPDGRMEVLQSGEISVKDW